MEDQNDTHKGLIVWFARNPVAANLLMVSIILIGLFTAFTIRKQMFPQIEINWINVSMIYPGAAPQEVEEAITVKLEEALTGVQGLKRVITRSNRGYASAAIEVMDDYDAQIVLDEVKSAVDAIPSFPDGMERPNISRVKYRQEVMYISLAGDFSAFELKRMGRQILNELRALPTISIVDYYSGANYEIGIEVSKEKMHEYGFSFNEIASAVRNASANKSAGQLRTQDGYISVRVEEQAYIGEEFERLPLRTRPDGTTILLGDVATVNDGFEEGINYTKLNGVNTVTFFVGATQDQSITDVADILNTYIEGRQKTLPEGIILEPWVDLTYYLNGRLNMMLSNMLWGGILVFIILALFLRMKLAMWVMMGLPVSFLGAVMLLPMGWVDVTINVGSLFAFIMVLGVVVDDAIVIGESIHSEVEEKGQSIDNVIRGAKRVAMPATFGVLTTVAAFSPMVMATGPQAAFPHAIGFVVVLCLLFSLVESKLILPAHLAHMKPLNPNATNPIARLQGFIDRKQKSFIENHYRPFLSWAIHFRYVILASFTAIIFITGGMFAGGIIQFIGSPKIPHDFVRINVEMTANTSEQKTLETILELERLVKSVEADIEKEHGQVMIDKLFVSLEGRTRAEIQAKLVNPDDRPIGTFDLSALWREKMPKITGLKSLTIVDDVFGGGTNDGDLSFRINGKNIKELRQAAVMLKDAMKNFDGVYDVADSEQSVVQEVRFTLKPQAYSLGLTTTDVARQASFSFYGIEAQRIVRDTEEIRVMVRYPESERNVLSAVNNLLISTPAGKNVPFTEVAEISLVDGVSQIYREDGDRTITVWASVNNEITQPLTVANDLKDNVFKEVKRNFPKVNIAESGSLEQERSSAMDQIRDLFLILVPIYLLLALPLRSYSQPLMIMSVIPFGVVGAIWGHIILGFNLSALSVFGIFAAIGVVVNDSLVMVDYVNQAKARGLSSKDAVMLGGVKRFRAIILTSLTTFIGLVPILSETSLQAQIVIPMAISLAFGVLFATVVTLILVPCLYLILEDIKKWFSKVGAWILPYRNISD